MTRRTSQGTVYLLHFDRPYQHARHYTGWAQDLDTRLADYRAGRGTRLLEVLRNNGIEWELGRTRTGPRARERQLKRGRRRIATLPQIWRHTTPNHRSRPSGHASASAPRYRRPPYHRHSTRRRQEA